MIFIPNGGYTLFYPSSGPPYTGVYLTSIGDICLVIDTENVNIDGVRCTILHPKYGLVKTFVLDERGFIGGLFE